MSARTLHLKGLVFALLLVQAGGVSAQVDPADIRSGFHSFSGQSLPAFFTVPMGSTLVLTDITWSTTMVAGDQASVTLTLFSGMTPRWSMNGGYHFDPASGFQSGVFQSHLCTGLVFNPGESLYFQSTGQPMGRTAVLMWSGYLVSSTPSSIGEAVAPARPATLGQNKPNPFNPTTEIRYNLSSPGKADLRIYDTHGRQVRSLVEQVEQAGEHVVVWDGETMPDRAWHPASTTIS